MFLESASELKDIPDRYGRSPLYYTIKSGNLGFVKLLLKKGVDLNARYEDDTILNYGWYPEELDIIDVLLNKGLDVNAKNIFGETPFYCAVTYRSLDYTEFLMERGANLYVTDIDGQTPLHAAARVGYIEAILMLLAKGVDRNVKNKEGKTPLDLVKVRNYQLCIDALQ